MFFKKDYVFKNRGYCPTCTTEVSFIAKGNWFRDEYVCSNCGSLPRERALMTVIEKFYPNWKDFIIHESSPCNRGASVRLSKECRNYIPSQLFPGIAPGEFVNGCRCENFENLTFDNESVDLHISQDVMEHILSPSKAFSEIARTLRPGGAHIFTVPLVNKNMPSERRIVMRDDGQLNFIKPPYYHGNPLTEDGSLVTVDWGFDICSHIFNSCGLFTHIIHIDDLDKGIRAELIEVLVTVKRIDNIDQIT